MRDAGGSADCGSASGRHGGRCAVLDRPLGRQKGTRPSGRVHCGDLKSVGMEIRCCCVLTCIPFLLFSRSEGVSPACDD